MADVLIDSQVSVEGGGAGMLKKSLPGLSSLDNLSEMTMLRQIGLLVGLIVSVTIGFAIMLWSQQPDYKPFYGSLNGVSTDHMVEALTVADIPYKVELNFSVLLVKADDLGRAHMKMAPADVAPVDNSVGLEILDKGQVLGASQFVEATNYHRGLEGELAHIMSSLNNVKAARVYPAVPKSPAFIRDSRKPSTSVLIELYPGRSPEPSQVMAIVNPVITSAPELDKSQVTVIDQKGNPLSDQQELPELTMAGKQLDLTRRMEGLFTQRVHNILQPILSNGRYRAEVSADVDSSVVELTSEMYNPDQPALRGEQRNNEKQQSSSGPQSIPGALLNQPPGPANAPQQATASVPTDCVALGQPLKDTNDQTIIDPKIGKPELAPRPTDRRDQTTRNHELDHSISYTKQQQGYLRRLSVAVVLDDQMRVDAKTGEVSHQPQSVGELARFTRLVQGSVGYDASHGDSVSVINMPFAPAQAEEIDSTPFYSRPWFWNIVKQMFGMLFILVLAFGVLRPVLSNIVGGGKGKSLAGDDGHDDDPALGESDLEGSLAGGRVSIGGLSSTLLSSPMGGYDAWLSAIKDLVVQDPGCIAQAVKEWINADG